MRYRHCVEKAGVTSCLTLDHAEGPTGNRFWGRRNEEYIADFELTSRRSLNEEEYEVFKWHFLYGADWKLCIDRIGVDKGTFFHRVYLLQEKLGRVFREMLPYALFPIDEYFSGIARKKICVMQLRRSEEPLDETIVASTNLIEMPLRNNSVSHRFPTRKRGQKKVA